MDADQPPRLPTAVLVGFVAAALGLGWLWWTSNPPPPGGTAPPADVLAGSELVTGIGRPLPAELEEPAEPDGPGFVSNGSGWGEPLGEAEIAALLPPAEDVVVREGATVDPNTALFYYGPAPTTGDYRLQVACRGQDEAEAKIVLTVPGGSMRQHTVPCDLTLTDIDISYLTGYSEIQMSPQPGDTPTEFAFQIVRQ